MLWQWRPRPLTGALLLSLLFAAHVLCAAGAVDSASASEADGTAATDATDVTAATTGSASAGVGSHPTGGAAEQHHHPCPSDTSASADHRTSSVAGAVLLGLGSGTGTTPLRAPVARAVPSQPSDAAAVPWSGTRLLFSLCVQRV